MGGRERVRRHLSGGAADRPPLIAFATEFAARLEQTPPSELWQDANVLTRTLLGLETLFGLDAIVVDVPAAVLSAGPLAVVADVVGRLRALLEDRAALVLALPGPLTCAAARADRLPNGLEALGAEILDVVKELGPERADCIAIVERVPARQADAEAVEEAITPVWNAARYYAAASLLVAADGVPELARSGADAVAVWSGTSPAELAAAGARRVGCLVDPATGADAPQLPELPAGGFYMTAELSADTDTGWLYRLVEAVGQ